YAHGDLDEASGLAERFLRDWPDEVRLINILGRCELKRGNFAAATHMLQRARILNPFNPERLVELGGALLRSGRLDAAGEAFSSAADLDGNHRPARLGQSTVKLMKGEINDALGILAKVADPREMASIFNTAAILTIKSG